MRLSRSWNVSRACARTLLYISYRVRSRGRMLLYCRFWQTVTESTISTTFCKHFCRFCWQALQTHLFAPQKPRFWRFCKSLIMSAFLDTEISSKKECSFNISEVQSEKFWTALWWDGKVHFKNHETALSFCQNNTSVFRKFQTADFLFSLSFFTLWSVKMPIKCLRMLKIT